MAIDSFASLAEKTTSENQKPIKEFVVDKVLNLPNPTKDVQYDRKVRELRNHLLNIDPKNRTPGYQNEAAKQKDAKVFAERLLGACGYPAINKQKDGADVMAIDQSGKSP